MFEFSDWIVSITCICLFSIVVDLVLPRGKTNVIIKRVISYVMILVFLMPISKLLNADFSINELFYNSEYVVQDNYIYNLNQNKLDTTIMYICNDLEELGIVGVDVSISADIFDRDMKINGVYVDLCNVVISKKVQNIDIKTEVVCVVQKYLSVGEDKIVFYE